MWCGNSVLNLVSTLLLVSDRDGLWWTISRSSLVMILAKATAPFVLWPAVTWLNQLHASVPTLPTDIHSCWQVFCLVRHIKFIQRHFVW